MYESTTHACTLVKYLRDYTVEANRRLSSEHALIMMINVTIAIYIQLNVHIAIYVIIISYIATGNLPRNKSNKIHGAERHYSRPLATIYSYV